MSAKLTMHARHVHYDRLQGIEGKLALALGEEHTRHNADMARRLLKSHRIVCDDLLDVGFHAQKFPLDINEAKAVM